MIYLERSQCKAYSMANASSVLEGKAIMITALMTSTGLIVKKICSGTGEHEHHSLHQCLVLLPQTC